MMIALLLVSGARASDQDLTDAQILKVTETVNSGEIQQAKLARGKTKSTPIKQFAMHMISAHTKANEQGAMLSKQEKLAPEASSLAADMSAKGAATLDALKTASSSEFDKTYIDAQVQQHQTVLNMFSEKLIPSASDAALKAQLEAAKKMVESHLAAARKLQAELATAPAAP